MWALDKFFNIGKKFWKNIGFLGEILTELKSL